MSGPDRRSLALHWLALARGDLRAAEALRDAESAPAREAAALAQQAAEKALTGALILAGLEPPRTHDLRRLQQLLTPTSQAGAIDLDELSGALRAARYPMLFEPAIDPPTARRLVASAAEVVTAILADLEAAGLETPGPA